MANLFGRKKKPNKNNPLKNYLVNSNIVKDSQYFFILSIKNDQSTNSIDIELDRGITLFNIRGLFYSMLPESKIDRFEFDNLSPMLKINGESMFKIKPHIYEANLDHIEKLKYIKTDSISIFFIEGIPKDLKMFLTSSLVELVKNKQKITILNN